MLGPTPPRVAVFDTLGTALFAGGAAGASRLAAAVLAAVAALFAFGADHRDQSCSVECDALDGNVANHE